MLNDILGMNGDSRLTVLNVTTGEMFMGYKGNLTGDGDWEIVKIDMKYVEGYFGEWIRLGVF